MKTTINLSEYDVKRIVADYIKTQKGYSVTANDIKMIGSSEWHGDERYVAIFGGCEVIVDE